MLIGVISGKNLVAELKIYFGKAYLPTVSTGYYYFPCAHLPGKFGHKLKAFFVSTQGWVALYIATRRYYIV